MYPKSESTDGRNLVVLLRKIFLCYTIFVTAYHVIYIEMLEQYCKAKGLAKAGFIRQAIKDKMERES